MRRVWIEQWQMGCCGEPLRTGDTVEWSVHTVVDHSWYALVLGEERASLVTDVEEHHGNPNRILRPLNGLATSIQAVYCRYGPQSGDSRVLVPVPETCVLQPRTSVDGREPHHDTLTLVGYLVDVR